LGRLVCQGLTKRFPGVIALAGVDFGVDAGEVAVLLGENGAGKSTLAKILAGIERPDSGTMMLEGDPYHPSTPAEAIASGIATIHQETSLLPGLSVAENVFLGHLPVNGGFVDHPRMRAEARAQLERVGLRIDPATPVRRLSVAARQQVEIAKALALEARVLILDEPTAPLGGDDVEKLFEVLDALRERGVAFIYISHRLEEVARVGDRIFVLRDGHRVATWDTAEVPIEQLIQAMVGRRIDQVYPDPHEPREEALLRVENLSRTGAFRDISFELRRGEVLGIAGLVGAGRTELARALFGAEPPDSGTIALEGRPLKLRTPADAVAAGICLVPEDRKEQGLALGLSLEDNIALPSLTLLASGGLLRPSRRRRLVRKLSERLHIRGRPRQSARTLSGGNQQKAVIAKWLPRKPKLVIFDEPTRGIDVGAKSAIYDVIQELAGEGIGVIVISSELLEVLGLCNRVLVLSRGRQTGLLDRSEADQERVLSLAVSG
jgi:ribose transport system ATP-binding protein